MTLFQMVNVHLLFQITDFPTSVLIAAASHALSPSNISVKEVFQTVSKQGNPPFKESSGIRLY